jgi:hypothetical protein
MHYHVEVGIPAGELRDLRDVRKPDGYSYKDCISRIHAEINLVMRKYDDSGDISEEEMREYGIMPTYTEEDEDGKRWLYNPEGLYDWYEIGGRWKLTKVPDEGPYISESLIDGESSTKPTFRMPYNSLHTSKLHNGCGLPMHVITWEEPYDMTSIFEIEIHKDFEEMSFREYMIAVMNKTGQYDDYIWTTVDIHI